MPFNMKADGNESGTTAERSVGAAGVTPGDEWYVMLLRDEAHLSASSQMSPELAGGRSTLHCSAEQLRLALHYDDAVWGFLP